MTGKGKRTLNRKEYECAKTNGERFHRSGNLPLELLVIKKYEEATKVDLRKTKDNNFTAAYREILYPKVFRYI